jgi:hypothetical protein
MKKMLGLFFIPLILVAIVIYKTQWNWSISTMILVSELHGKVLQHQFRYWFIPNDKGSHGANFDQKCIEVSNKDDLLSCLVSLEIMDAWSKEYETYRDADIYYDTNDDGMFGKMCWRISGWIAWSKTLYALDGSIPEASENHYYCLLTHPDNTNMSSVKIRDE